MADDMYERTFLSTMEQQPLLGTGAKYSERAANRAFRRVGWKILPWTFLMSAVASLQYYRTLTSARYSTAGLLFVPYILFQVPSIVILKRVGAPVWLGALFIGWGLTVAMTAIVNDMLQLYFLLLLLGAMAAGTYPGIIYYVAQFFPDSRLSHVFGFSFAGSALGLGTSLALVELLGDGYEYGYLYGYGYEYWWPWAYVLEGLPAVVLGFLIMCVLPSGPKACMTHDELMILHHEKAACQKKQGDDDGAAPRNFWRLATSVICNVKILVLLVVMVLSGTLWKTLWHSAMTIGWWKVEVSVATMVLLYALPFVMAGVGSWLFGWTSAILKDRTNHILVLCSISGLIVMPLGFVSARSVFGLVLLILGHLGVNGVVPLLCSMQMSFLSEEERNFGTAWVNGVANLCWWVGRMIPLYIPLWLTGGVSIVSGLIALSLEDSVRKEYWGRRRLPSIQS